MTHNNRSTATRRPRVNVTAPIHTRRSARSGKVADASSTSPNEEDRSVRSIRDRCDNAMSIQALGWALDHSTTRGAERLVLLSIANHAGKSPIDGAWEAWPGIATIQREAGLDRKRTVYDVLLRLEAGGHVERDTNGAPDERIRKDHRPNLYRIVVANGVTCDDTACHWCGVTPDARRGDAPRPDGVTPRVATGCRPASPEPSLNRHVTEVQPNALVVASDNGAAPSLNARARRILDALWDERKANGDPTPANYPATMKAIEACLRSGWPDDPVAACCRTVPTITARTLEVALRGGFTSPSAARVKEQRTVDAMRRRAAQGNPAPLSDEAFLNPEGPATVGTPWVTGMIGEGS